MHSCPIFKKNLETLQAKIHAVCKRIRRDPREIKILPVTKGQDTQTIQFVTQAHLIAIGENKIQEAFSKKQNLSHSTISLHWELIGHLQSNKAKLAVQTFDRIQSVDSEKLLLTLNHHAHELKKSPYPILLQVNTAHDPAKFGLEEDQVRNVIKTVIHQCPHIKLEGLMTIAPLIDDTTQIRESFRKLKQLRDQLQNEFNITLPELSMGMSNDWEIAIEEGSTILRIGSLLFGERQ